MLLHAGGSYRRAGDYHPDADDPLNELERRVCSRKSRRSEAAEGLACTFLRSPQPDTAGRDFKFANSSAISSNMKSAGNRALCRAQKRSSVIKLRSAVGRSGRQNLMAGWPEAVQCWNGLLPAIHPIHSRTVSIASSVWDGSWTWRPSSRRQPWIETSLPPGGGARSPACRRSTRVPSAS